MPADAAIDASVDIGPIPARFGIAVRLAISLPGMDSAVAQDLVQAAQQVCPYSNATRGNIEVELKVVESGLLNPLRRVFANGTCRLSALGDIEMKIVQSPGDFSCRGLACLRTGTCAVARSMFLLLHRGR